MIQQAYEQFETLEELSNRNQSNAGLEEMVDEEFKIRSRDVGHNIYILAHQVRSIDD